MRVLPPTDEDIYLNALNEGLINYLEDKTEIDWQYYKTSAVPSIGAKGGIKISKVPPVEGMNLDTLIRNYVFFQGRVIVAVGESEGYCQNVILAWQQYLQFIFKSLSLKGLQGEWQGVQIRNGLLGIKPSERGYQLAIDETLTNQSSDDSIWTGLLFFEYFCEYELLVKGSL